jgi:hypothetical protein
MDELELGREFFVMLEQADERTVQQAVAEGCAVCGGPLHHADFARKPRGALIAPEGEPFVKRFSLCCGREGCRKRRTPPSLRFLGRRVYLGVVVIVASLVAQALGAARALRQKTGVPARTVRRWLSWWGGAFIATEVFVAIRARLVGVDESQVPASIVERLPGSRTEQVRATLDLLWPLTTGSARDGARLSRGIA